MKQKTVRLKDVNLFRLKKVLDYYGFSENAFFNFAIVDYYEKIRFYEYSVENDLCPKDPLAMLSDVPDNIFCETERSD